MSAARLWVAIVVTVVVGFASAVFADDDVAADPRPEVVLWHSYRADEAAVVDEIVRDLNAHEKDFRVKVLAVPYDAYLDKITAAIPRGRGPDVFIAAHDGIGDWAEAKTIDVLDDVFADPATSSGLVPGLMGAVSYRGHVYGYPLAFKSVALWRNTRRVKDAPADLDALLQTAQAQTKDGAYGLVYENRDLYFHAPLLFGFGGHLFGADGKTSLDASENVASVKKAIAIHRSGVVPQEVSGALTLSLFNDDKAAFIITGPWSRGEVNKDIPLAVSALPDVVGADGVRRPMTPFLTVEAAFVSGKTEKRALALQLVARLADEQNSRARLLRGKQPVALERAWAALDGSDVDAADAAFLRGFRAQLPRTVPTPNTPAMKALWGPFNLALGESIGQGSDPQTTLSAAQQKVADQMAVVDAPEQDHKNDPGFFVVVAVLAVLAVAFVVRNVRAAGGVAAIVKDAKQNGLAYAWTAPAMSATALLVFFPFVVGLGMSFFRHSWGRYSFVGIQNFIDIVVGSDSTFFRILGVTVLWTASNVVLHVSIGLVLALVLSQAQLRFRGLYRVLFVVPWAVPSYITALVWKGMFHPEFGAINVVLGWQGFSWMSSFGSAFCANLITNTWLGFPFMMVTALGGLTSIPKDLYEAAALDGATAWQRFTRITLPLLRPTLAPAVVLGTVWTFNMFNVIYLVSGGAPGGRTDILITEAFRWAFERGQGGAFGMAAAYSTLIFLMLLGYSVAANRVSRAVSGGAA